MRIAQSCERYGGDDPRNIVNRLAAPSATGVRNGIQIEQSLQARCDHWFDIADAVADVYDRLLDAPQ